MRRNAPARRKCLSNRTRRSRGLDGVFPARRERQQGMVSLPEGLRRRKKSGRRNSSQDVVDRAGFVGQGSGRRWRDLRFIRKRKLPAGALTQTALVEIQVVFRSNNDS